MKVRNRGFTMVELLVALLIGLFLLGGLLTMVQDNRRTFDSQSKLSQLQDNERLAMTMMTDVIQQAGYYPDPTNNSPQSTMPTLTAPVMSSGQALFGTSSGTAPGDAIYIRYATSGTDGVLNCAGQPSGVPQALLNQFSVVNATVNGVVTGQLTCTVGNTAYQLVSGVHNLSVLYGVSTTGGTTVNQYLTATQVTAGGFWNNVISVQISLDFENPLYVAGNTDQPQYRKIKRTIAVMNQVGL